MPETSTSFEDRYKHHRDRIIADLRRRAQRRREEATHQNFTKHLRCIAEAKALEALADDMASLGQ